MLLTFDAEAPHFWLTRDYFPELLTLDHQIMPSLDALAEELGKFVSTSILIPHDCSDGFLGAYWRRPEVYLDLTSRKFMSSFARVEADHGLSRLSADMNSGVWRERNADILTLDALDVGYRLLLWKFEES